MIEHLSATLCPPSRPSSKARPHGHNRSADLRGQAVRRVADLPGQVDLPVIVNGVIHCLGFCHFLRLPAQQGARVFASGDMHQTPTRFAWNLLLMPLLRCPTTSLLLNHRSLRNSEGSIGCQYILLSLDSRVVLDTSPRYDCTTALRSTASCTAIRLPIHKRAQSQMYGDANPSQEPQGLPPPRGCPQCVW